MKNKFLFVLISILLHSCGYIKETQPKSYTISSIKNKGVIIEMRIEYCKRGILIINTGTDIVDEKIGNVDIEPTKTIFYNLLSIGDTIK